MRIYLGGGCLPGFDRRRAFGSGYMAGNHWAGREYGEHDENLWDIEANRRQKDSWTPDSPLSPTGKEARHVRLLLFVIGVNGVADVGIDSGFNHEL